MEHPDNERILMLFKKLDAQVTCLGDTLKKMIDVLQQPKETKPMSVKKKTRPGPKPKVRSPPDVRSIELKEMLKKG